MSFKDKVILVTGSTSGIGQGIAKALLEEGAKVIINYAHNENNADETRELFKDYIDNTLFIKADISDENSVINMYKKIKEKFGKLDVYKACYSFIKKVKYAKNNKYCFKTRNKANG